MDNCATKAEALQRCTLSSTNATKWIDKTYKNALQQMMNTKATHVKLGQQQ